MAEKPAFLSPDTGDHHVLSNAFICYCKCDPYIANTQEAKGPMDNAVVSTCEEIN